MTVHGPERRGPERPGPDYPAEWDGEPEEEDVAVCGGVHDGNGCDCPPESLHMAPHPDDWPSADAETLRARIEKLARQYQRLSEELHLVPAADAFHDAALDLRRALDGDR